MKENVETDTTGKPAEKAIRLEKTLHEVTRDLLSAEDVPGVLREIVELARSGADADASYLERVNFARDEVEVVAAAGDLVPPVGTRMPYPGSLAKDVIEQDTPEVVTVEEITHRKIGRILSRTCGDCVALVAPLISERIALGALTLLRRPEKPSFTLDEIGRLRAIADMAALALRHLLLQNAAQRQLRELNESERRFRALVESVRDYAIFMLDPQGRITSWNRGAERIKGYRDTEVLGEHLSIFYPKDQRETGHPEQNLTAAGQKGSYEEEGWRVRKDGSRFWAQVTITAVRDDQGDLVGYAKVTRDLTERKLVEEERERLLEQERQGRSQVVTVLERITDAFFALDREWRFTYLNPAAETLLQRPREELLGKSIWEEFPEAVGSVFYHEYHRAVREGLVVQVTEFYPPLEIWFEVRAYPGDNGLTVYFQDVTRRREDEEERERLLAREREAREEAERRAKEESALREATETVTASFDLAMMIQRIAEGALQATHADGAFVERLNIAGDEVEVVAVAGERVPEPGTLGRYAGSYTERVLRCGEPELVNPGQPRPFSLSDGPARACGDCAILVLPLLSGHEEIGALFVVRNAEGRTFRPDDIARAHTFAKLAALAYRKVHLFRDSEQKREELRTAMDSRARLLRGFSHDVKNPLGAADGFLALLEDGILGNLEEQQVRAVGRARRAILSGLALISDLSELARVEAGQMEIATGPVNLAEIVAELTEEYRPQVQSKGLAVAYHLPDRLPVIASDANRIRQILGNLISNAAKYTLEGRIDVTVAARSPDGAKGPEGSAAISVADTGPGIPEDKRFLLFQEFSRLDPEAAPGVGLGLAISRKVAHALGGHITVESEMGHGSTFTLWLPLTGQDQGKSN